MEVGATLAGANGNGNSLDKSVLSECDKVVSMLKGSADVDRRDDTSSLYTVLVQVLDILHRSR